MSKLTDMFFVLIHHNYVQGARISRIVFRDKMWIYKSSRKVSELQKQRDYWWIGDRCQIDEFYMPSRKYEIFTTRLHANVKKLNAQNTTLN